MPEFSIIVPSYNRPAFLAEALHSVQSQSIDDFECLVVDDGSELPPALPPDTRFRLIRRPRNGGPAAAFNSGLGAASGEVVIRLDDDDLFTPDRLSLAREGLERAPIALCWTRTLGEPNGRASGRRLDGDVADTILDATTPPMGTAAVRRDRFLELDERYHGSEDVEWWLRTARSTAVATVPKAGYIWRRHAGPRVAHGAAARIAGSKLLLEEHADYFATHRRAAAFRWKRIGLLERAQGNTAASRAALLRSLRISPSLRTAKHLVV